MNILKPITKGVITFLIGFVFSHCSSGNKTNDLTDKNAVENIIQCTPDDDLNKLLKPGVTLELFPGKYRKNLVIEQDNIVYGARRFSISARAGYGSVFKDNTCKDGLTGIRILGSDHVVSGNNLIRMRRAGILLRAAKNNGDGFAAENTEIFNNTFIDCGGADVNPIADSACSGIIIGNRLKQQSAQTNFKVKGRILSIVPVMWINRDFELFIK